MVYQNTCKQTKNPIGSIVNRDFDRDYLKLVDKFA